MRLMPIALYDKDHGRRLFEITAAQRDELVAALEEESSKAHDYYIDADVIDFLDGKVDSALLAKLRPLVGAVPTSDGAAAESEAEVVETDSAPEGIEIEWREE
jgi:uncharacterized tellurite resistance protein B-like protein